MILGESADELSKMSPNSIDALVTDPPAGISFMQKEWDHHKGGRDEWIKWLSSIMQECMRVMRPGAHGLVWAIPRTSHWTATALENAGFEIRDVVTHLFGSGFPKSLNISIAIDKQRGAMGNRGKALDFAGPGDRKDIKTNEGSQSAAAHNPITDAAIQWSGWGTALKPASEHWILIRKPISEKTIAANILKWGTGGINIDVCRIETSDKIGFRPPSTKRESGAFLNTNEFIDNPQGRFPANLILDEVAGEMLDKQSGPCKTGDIKPHKNRENDGSQFQFSENITSEFKTDSATGASRFFYCAKASKRERNLGLEGMPSSGVRRHGDRAPDVGRQPQKELLEQNHHPTVKPIKLMEYLIKLITPPNGVVLDPFMGSGSTGVAAKSLGFKFVGIEMNPEYFEIAKKRIHAQEWGLI